MLRIPMRAVQSFPVLLLAIFVLAGTCCTAGVQPREPALLPPARPGVPSQRALPSCREAWASLPESVRGYRFDTDSVATARGNQGYTEYASRVARASCEKEWTVLLYMAADARDMTGPALSTLRQLEAAGPGGAASGLDADLVVQLDVLAPGIRRLHVFSAPPAAPLQAETGEAAEQLRSPLVEWLEEETIPPGESLRRFLLWGVERYPARRYMVIVWGHGLGWLPAGPAPPFDKLQGGLLLDESQRTVLDVPSLGGALQEVSRAALRGRPFDVFIADACLMQTLEVDAELAGAARYFLGSEAKFDYTGLPYPALLARLNRAAEDEPRCPPKDAACAVAVGLPRLITQGAQGPSGGLPEHFLFSSVDAQGLERQLRPAVHRLGAAIAAFLDEDPMRAAPVRELLAVRTGTGPAAERYVPDFPNGTRDLGVFLRRLRSMAEREASYAGGEPSAAIRRLLTEIDTVREVMQRVVLGLSTGSRYREERFTGLAGLGVWLPRCAEDWVKRGPQFTPSRFYRSGAEPAGAPGWQGWLRQLFSTPSSPCPEPVSESVPPSSSIRRGGVNFSG
jgi:hypothetical protein